MKSEKKVGTSLVVYGQNSYGILYNLRSKINEVDKLLNSIRFDIDQMNERFVGYDVEVAQEIARLEAVLEDLTPETEIDEPTMVVNKVDEVKTAASSVHTKSKLKKTCRKLYLEICKKCHPDKVKESKLVEMFHQAKSAMQDLNHGMLQAILLSIDESLFSPISERDQIAFLELELRKKEQELEELYDSEDYQLYEVYSENSFQQALGIRNRALRITLAQLREEICNLGGSI